MTRFVIADADGRILRVCGCPDGDFHLQAGAIEIGDAEISDLTHYVSAGVVTARADTGAAWDKLTIVADGVDAATLSPLPIGVEVSVDGQIYTVTDGSLVVTAEDIGAYRVRVESPQYLGEWIVEAS